ncbi:ABC transporter permease [Elioraea sp.]|uniref:ABC transporter permease n=1 Tax=Elioraea sp. TaxID=2185103 RepID=UPI0025B9A0CE|nr:ABC transporter permease [Elioraea sp.]
MRQKGAALVLPNFAWLALFMLGPLITLFVISFRTYEAGRGIQDAWTIAHYVAFVADPYHLGILLRTLRLGIEVTAWCLVLGFPMAYGLSRLRGTPRALLYFVVLLPLLTSAVVRTFGWMIVLSNNGFINRTLIDLGVIDSPIRFMYSMLGIVVALVQVLLPFMVLALDAALLNIDPRVYEAARNLGASRLRVFLQITLPLSLPGILSGSVLVFTLAISAFVTPSLIGGPRVPVMATLIYQQGMSLLNWPFGGAIAFVMLATVVVLFLIAMRLARQERGT